MPRGLVARREERRKGGVVDAAAGGGDGYGFVWFDGKPFLFGSELDMDIPHAVMLDIPTAKKNCIVSSFMFSI